MSSPVGVSVLRTQIMDAIEALRLRKSKPDRETIAHYVLKKHSEEGFDFAQIFTELENTVDDGQLLKVEYKGTTSYRHPSSFDQKSSPLLTKHSKILNSTRTTRLLVSTVTELFDAWNDTGIPLAVLKDKLITDVDSTRFTPDKIDLILDREFFMSNNTIVLVDKDKKQIPTPKGNISVSATAPADSYVWWSKDLKAENFAAEEKHTTTPNMSTRRSKRKNSDGDKELEKNTDGENDGENDGECESESKIVKLVDNDSVQDEDLNPDNGEEKGENNGTDNKNEGKNHHDKNKIVENVGKEKETEDDEDNWYDEIEEILQNKRKKYTKKATKSNKKNDTLSTSIKKQSDPENKVGKKKNSLNNNNKTSKSESNIEKLTKQIVVEKKFKVEKKFDDAVKKISDNLRKKSDKSPSPPSKSASPNSPVKTPTISPSSLLTPKEQQSQQPHRISSRTKRKREVFDPSDYHSKSAQFESTTPSNQVSHTVSISTPTTSKSKLTARPQASPPPKSKPSKPDKSDNPPQTTKRTYNKRSKKQSEDMSTEIEVKKEVEEFNIGIEDDKNHEKDKSPSKPEPSVSNIEESVKVDKDAPIQVKEIKVKQKDLQKLKEKIINISKTKKKTGPKKKKKLSPKNKQVVSKVEVESIVEDKKEDTEDLKVEVEEKEKVVEAEEPKELEEGEILPESQEKLKQIIVENEAMSFKEDQVKNKINIELSGNYKVSTSTIETEQSSQGSMNHLSPVSTATDVANDKNVPDQIPAEAETVISPKKSKRKRKLSEECKLPSTLTTNTTTTTEEEENYKNMKLPESRQKETPTKSEVINMDIDVVNEVSSVQVDCSNQKNEKNEMDIEQDHIKVEEENKVKEKANDIKEEENLQQQQVLKSEDEENRNNQDCGLGLLNESALDINQVQEWSSADVEEYFKSKGLAEEGQILKDELIDGLALLLLSREDVLYGLKFKIGPALKIYRVVYNLQNDTPSSPEKSLIKP